MLFEPKNKILLKNSKPNIFSYIFSELWEAEGSTIMRRLSVRYKRVKRQRLILLASDGHVSWFFKKLWIGTKECVRLKHQTKECVRLKHREKERDIRIWQSVSKSTEVGTMKTIIPQKQLLSVRFSDNFEHISVLV